MGPRKAARGIGPAPLPGRRRRRSCSGHHIGDTRPGELGRRGSPATNLPPRQTAEVSKRQIPAGNWKTRSHTRGRSDVSPTPIRAYHAATSEAWMDGHVHAFAFFGVVPLFVVHDNDDSCLVAKFEAGGRRRRTQMFTEMLSHYLFDDRYGRPGKGNDEVGPEPSTSAVERLSLGVFKPTRCSTRSPTQPGSLGGARHQGRASPKDLALGRLLRTAEAPAAASNLPGEPGQTQTARERRGSVPQHSSVFAQNLLQRSCSSNILANMAALTITKRRRRCRIACSGSDRG